MEDESHRGRNICPAHLPAARRIKDENKPETE